MKEEKEAEEEAGVEEVEQGGEYILEREFMIRRQKGGNYQCLSSRIISAKRVFKQDCTVDSCMRGPHKNPKNYAVAQRLRWEPHRRT